MRSRRAPVSRVAELELREASIVILGSARLKSVDGVGMRPLRGHRGAPSS